MSILNLCYSCCLLSRKAWGILFHSSLKTIFSSCTVRVGRVLSDTRLSRTSQKCSIGFRPEKYTSHCMLLMPLLSSVFDILLFLCGRALSSINRKFGPTVPLKIRTWSISLHYRCNVTLPRSKMWSAVLPLCIIMPALTNMPESYGSRSRACCCA